MHVIWLRSVKDAKLTIALVLLMVIGKDGLFEPYLWPFGSPGLPPPPFGPSIPLGSVGIPSLRSFGAPGFPWVPLWPDLARKSWFPLSSVWSFGFLGLPGVPSVGNLVPTLAK